MHEWSGSTERLAEEILAYVRSRLRGGDALRRPVEPRELSERVGATISEEGFGEERALRLFLGTLD